MEVGVEAQEAVGAVEADPNLVARRVNVAKQAKAQSQSNQKRYTQAVVIIHGMGEQRPMETLRTFARAILPEPKQGGPKFFSRPDTFSESFELRVLQDRSQPRTHFFEYYWADKMTGTAYKHVVGWLTTLLFRGPKNVPKKLIPVWVISWLLVTLTLLGTITGIFIPFRNLTTQSSSAVVSLLSLAVLGAVQWFILYFVGDVARYLNPAPENIKIRQSIRADGIRLLKRIHEAGAYDRVILVGHSLGSFVAYDILRYLWQEYHEQYQKAETSSQEALKDLEKVGEDLRNRVEGVTSRNYMDSQLKLWKELRSLGHPWLVTDLITMGSPLTYALLVLAKNKEDLLEQQSQRELPVNPPEPEVRDGNKVYSYLGAFGTNQDINLRALHTGAPFAVTRWTNFYFPGDLAGGPLTEFGPGIRNVTVRSGKSLVDHTILAHTSYWDQKAMSTQTSPNSIDELKSALDLKSEGYYHNQGQQKTRKIPPTRQTDIKAVGKRIQRK